MSRISDKCLFSHQCVGPVYADEMPPGKNAKNVGRHTIITYVDTKHLFTLSDIRNKSSAVAEMAA